MSATNPTRAEVDALAFTSKWPKRIAQFEYDGVAGYFTTRSGVELAVLTGPKGRLVMRLPDLYKELTGPNRTSPYATSKKGRRNGWSFDEDD